MRWLHALGLLALANAVHAKACALKVLGHGRDDTDQVLAAVSACGKNGHIILAPGTYNITRKMTWDLQNSVVDLYGTLSFTPDVAYWLDAANTYRVVFIQNQASWFVVTGSNFVIDAHWQGGIDGNGQTWWTYFANRTRADGDGRPIALTLSHARNAVVRALRIHAQPFWCNTVADSADVLYDGMACNATNTNAAYAGMNIVPNTDGLNTFRSKNVALVNWDITCGDDCLAIKGNSTNIYAGNITCRGGNGIAVGSLGQYSNLTDIVENVLMQDLSMVRLPASVQPNMQNGVYLKSWGGTVHGVPPTGGGGGTGVVRNVTARGVTLDRVVSPVHLYQTNGAKSGDAPSVLQFSGLTFENWSGTSTTSKIVDIECSAAAPCPGIRFNNFDVQAVNGSAPNYICKNVLSESGLNAPCNTTGSA